MEIRDKIRRMLARAENEATTENEAEFLAERVQKMLAESGLTLGDIGAEKSDYQSDTRIFKYSCGWRRKLADQIGRFLGASFSFVIGGEAATFHGKPECTDAAWELYTRLERACVQIPRARYPGDSRASRRAEKGVALGLVLRLQEIRLTLPESRLPVVQEHANSENWMNDQDPNIMKKDNKLVIDSMEAMAGFKMADSVKIQEQTR